MKHHIISTLFLLTVLNCQAQNKTNIYHIDWKKDAWLVGSGVGLLGVGYILHKKADIATPESVSLLQTNAVRSVDRGAIQNYSASAQKTSDILLYTSLALPITTFLTHKCRPEAKAIPIMAFEAYTITGGITSILKATVKRYRPYTYNTNLSIEERTSSTARKSFPSGHASSAAVASFFTAKILTDIYPDSKLKPLIWTAAATIPAATGYLRYKAGKHFPTDVIAGYAIGASIGYLVPALHKSKNVSLGVSPLGEADLLVRF
jgi:membrane-associated phospholipid phosphatase